MSLIAKDDKTITFSAHSVLQVYRSLLKVCIGCSLHESMTASLNEVISHLQSVIKEPKVLKATEDIDLASEDLAWELFGTMEELWFLNFDD